MKGLVLSLFPGADLFGTAFEEEGFSVVRGPDAMTGGDVCKFHSVAGRFDGVIGGPPCQSFSRAGMVSRKQGFPHHHGNLIPEFERVVRESAPAWWLMENVPEAPLPSLEDLRFSQVLDAWDFGARQHRNRRFSSNLCLGRHLAPLGLEGRDPDPFPCVLSTENYFSPKRFQAGHRQMQASRKVGRRLKLGEVASLMGLPGDWEAPALRVLFAYRVLGNGVPLPMGRALARSVIQLTGGVR